MAVQLHLEPSLLDSSMRTVLRTVSIFEQAIYRCRVFFRVLALCRQWCDVDDLRALILAYSHTPPGLVFSCLFSHAVKLLASGAPSVNKVAIMIHGAADPKTQACIGAQCQCMGEHRFRGVWQTVTVKWQQAVFIQMFFIAGCMVAPPLPKTQASRYVRKRSSSIHGGRHLDQPSSQCPKQRISYSICVNLW